MSFLISYSPSLRGRGRTQLPQALNVVSRSTHKKTKPTPDEPTTRRKSNKIINFTFAGSTSGTRRKHEHRTAVSDCFVGSTSRRIGFFNILENIMQKNKKVLPIYIDIENAVGHFLGIEPLTEDKHLLTILEDDARKYSTWFDLFDVVAVSNAIESNNADDLDILLCIYDHGDDDLINITIDADLQDLKHQIAVRAEACEARWNLANDILLDIDAEILKNKPEITVDESGKIEEMSFYRWARKRYGAKLEVYSPAWREKELKVLTNATKETLLTMVALIPLLLAKANPEKYQHKIGNDSKRRERVKQGIPNINAIANALENLGEQYPKLSAKRITTLINDAKHTMMIDYYLNPKPHFPSVHSCVILSKNSSINYLKSS